MTKPLMHDLFKKQFVFPSGVLTVGVLYDGQVVLDITLYGEIGGQANGDNPDDLFASNQLCAESAAQLQLELAAAKSYMYELTALIHKVQEL